MARPSVRSFVLVIGSLGVLSALPACEPEEAETDTAEPLGQAVSAINVAQAASSSCSTLSVVGLSQQIIAQAKCIEPDAFVEVPSLPNVTFGDAVFPYLEKPARDAFVAAIQSRPDLSMTVNSMLRTVAQQYLLHTWDEQNKCGISIAATPGNSNHETGLALDISQYSAWKSALEAKGFDWYGSGDAVHFDYAGAGAVSYKGTDVLAFQMLWNDNHPDDSIDEDGSWGPQTEARMAQSPADGFPRPVSCEVISPTEAPDLFPAIELTGASDIFADGTSAGVVDTFEGATTKLVVRIENRGEAIASGVVVALDLGADTFEATGYLIESAPAPDGVFAADPADDDPKNPPHAGAIGSTFDVALGDVPPGVTKRITVQLLATGYSVEEEGPADARAWVRAIEGVYEQQDFGGEVTSEVPQSFGGGRLELAARADVYSRTRWEWSSDRREGATTSAGASLRVVDGAIELSATTDAAFVATPATAVVTGRSTTVALKAQRAGGEGPAILLVAHDATGSLDRADRIELDLPDDGAPHAIELDGASEPSLHGTITRLAIVPFEGAAGTASVDYLRIEGGVTPGPDGVPGDTDEGDAASAGCACSAAVPGLLDARGALVVATALAALARRRRRALGVRRGKRERLREAKPRFGQDWMSQPRENLSPSCLLEPIPT